mgnify:CR=1 FL=1|jgi:hypothetical protein|tara:strand:+ start:772 stop:1479 length:708 start_codon:yes stop_codon:yes gene_type:complete
MIINMLLRGKSLKHFEQIKDKPDVVFLVNDMHREIDKVENLREYLLDKDINLVFNFVRNSEIGLKKINFFDEFNVTKLIRPYVVGTRDDDGAQDIPIENTFLDESHIPFMSIGSKYAYEYPGSGISGIAYAVLNCKPKVLNIVGLDFYDNLRRGESNYLVDNYIGRNYGHDLTNVEQIGEDFDEPTLTEWQYQMQNSLCDFADHIPSMKVNLWTACSKLIDRLKNQKNITIKEVE